MLLQVVGIHDGRHRRGGVRQRDRPPTLGLYAGAQEHEALLVCVVVEGKRVAEYLRREDFYILVLIKRRRRDSIHKEIRDEHSSQALCCK